MAGSKSFILAVLPEAIVPAVRGYLQARSELYDFTGSIPTQLGALDNLRDPKGGVILWGPVPIR